MILSELQKELNSLLDFYIRQDEGKETILKSWITGHTDDDCRLLKDLAVRKLQDEVRRVYVEDSLVRPGLDPNHESTKQDIQILSHEDYQIGYDDTCDAIFEFACDLVAHIDSYPLRDQHVNDKYLSNPTSDAREKFIRAEKWAFREKIIDETCKWQRNYAHLVGFLGALVKLGVIKQLKVDEMDSFYRDRYHIPPLKDQSRMRDSAMKTNVHLQGYYDVLKDKL